MAFNILYIDRTVFSAFQCFSSYLFLNGTYNKLSITRVMYGFLCPFHFLSSNEF